MKEPDFTKKLCCEIMHQKGAMIFPIVAHQMGEPGWPEEFHIYHDGKALRSSPCYRESDDKKPFNRRPRDSGQGYA